jgi:hypothetical protein
VTGLPSWSSVRGTDPVSTWARHCAAVSAARRLIELGHRNGIEVLPVKGIALAHVLYEDVALRPMADIDFKVRPRDFRPLVRAARAEGWRVSWEAGQFGSVSFRIGMVHAEVETFLGMRALCAIPVDAILERSTSSNESPFGVPHRMAEWNDHALLLCLNVYKDLLRPEPWAEEDLFRIAQHPDFSPARLVELAHAGGVREIVWLVAQWLTSRRDSPRWRDVNARIGPEPRPIFGMGYRKLVRTDPLRMPVLLVAQLGPDQVARRAFALGVLAVGNLRYRIKRRLGRVAE